MHIFDRFKQPAQLSGTNSPASVQSLRLTKSSGFGIAGVFILLAILAAAAFNTSGPTNAVHKASSSQPAQVNLQATDSSATPPAAPATSSASQSTNVTSTSNGSGGTSTQVTVNGQNVPVPANGSVSKDIGNTHVDVSHNQTSNGSATNFSSSTTSLNGFSSTDSMSVNTEGP